MKNLKELLTQKAIERAEETRNESKLDFNVNESELNEVKGGSINRDRKSVV